MVHENAMADQGIINLTCDIHISPYSFYVYSLPIIAMLLERMLFHNRKYVFCGSKNHTLQSYT